MNALIHRVYTIPGPIKIALYEDRFEIFSPGAFPGLVSLKTLGDGTAVLRNPRITPITRRLNEWIKRGRLVRIGQGRGTRYLQR